MTLFLMMDVGCQMVYFHDFSATPILEPPIVIEIIIVIFFLVYFLPILV